MPISVDPITTSSFDAPFRTLKYRKDPLVEEMLSRMNAGLRDVEVWLERREEGGASPMILVFGVPRSGTTLLVQTLAARLRVGYCSNLMARYHEAPAVGAVLQEELLGTRIHGLRDFASEHGATRRIEEPNEFGYFWSRHLGVAGELHEPTRKEAARVDLDRLRRELNAVGRVFGRPAVFKCMLGVFFVPILAQLPDTVFVHVQRKWSDVAASIYRTRDVRLGDVTRWWSFRPRVYPELIGASPEWQIAAQIRAIHDAVENGLRAVPASRKVHIRYEDLVSDPEGAVGTVTSTVAELGHETGFTGSRLSAMNASQIRPSDAVMERLEIALKQQQLS